MELCGQHYGSTMRSIIELFLFFIYIAPAIARHHCFDFEKNGDETGVDCGGNTCWQRCLPGDGCIANTDCNSIFCDEGTCADYTRLLSAHASGPKNTPQNGTQSYVVMPYDEFNRALLVVILMFFVPCGCIIITFLFKIYKRTEESNGLFDMVDPTRIELISGRPKNKDLDDVEEAML